MKNDEARQAMVAKVHAAYAKYPKFGDLPEVADGPIKFPEATLSPERYVQGLYAICANGDVMGRHGSSIVGSMTVSEVVQPEVTMRKGKK